nr:oocyte zinc finger protein XlCOF19-like [Leptinotarsa decemlineata]
MSEARTNKRSNNTFTCDICTKTFPMKFNLKRHLLTHQTPAEKIKFECKVCSKKFLRHDHLVEHEQIHSEKKEIACPYCPKKFFHQRQLTRHQGVHRDKLSCELCSKKFSLKENLTAHMKRAHEDGKKVLKKEKPFACTMCDKAYIHLRSLKAHLRRLHFLQLKDETDEEEQEDMEDRKTVIEKEKPFACTVCDKAYIHLRSLKTHQRRLHSLQLKGETDEEKQEDIED